MMPRCAWLALVFVLTVLGLSLPWASRYSDERWWLEDNLRPSGEPRGKAI